MTKWQEVESDKRYQKAPDDIKAKIQNDFFEQTILPEIPEGENVEAIRAEFIKRVAPVQKGFFQRLNDDFNASSTPQSVVKPQAQPKPSTFAPSTEAVADALPSTNKDRVQRERIAETRANINRGATPEQAAQISLQNEDVRQANSVAKVTKPTDLSYADELTEKPARSIGDVYGDTLNAVAKVPIAAAKGVADIGNLVTGDSVDLGVSQALGDTMKGMDEMYGSKALNYENEMLADIANSVNAGFTDQAKYLLTNPVKLADTAITTLGSAFIPAGVTTGTVAMASKLFGNKLSPAALAKLQGGSLAGTIAMQNAAETFNDPDIAKLPLADRYQAASITAIGTLFGNKVFGGGLEKAIADKFNKSGAAQGFALAGKEAGQEATESLSGSLGKEVVAPETMTLTQASSNALTEGLVGGVLGGGFAAVDTKSRGQRIIDKLKADKGIVDDAPAGDVAKKVAESVQETKPSEAIDIAELLDDEGGEPNVSDTDTNAGVVAGIDGQTSDNANTSAQDTIQGDGSASQPSAPLANDQGTAGALGEGDAVSTGNSDTTVTIDDKANEAATSSANDLPEPTQAQKEAGNYKVGRVKVGGLDISIENPDQSQRKGVDSDGKEWSSTMNGHYGYVKGVKARAPDKEHVDVNIKPSTPENYDGDVFVINQKDPKTGKFDEPKAYIGYSSEQEAEQAYRSNYAKDWQGFDGLARVPMAKFKEMLNDEKAFMKPVKSNNLTPLSKDTSQAPKEESNRERSDRLTKEGKAKHGYAENDERVNESGVITPDEVIEVGKNKYGLVNNHIDIAQTPNGKWLSSFNIMEANSGRGGPISVINGDEYDTREQAIAETAKKAASYVESEILRKKWLDIAKKHGNSIVDTEKAKQAKAPSPESQMSLDEFKAHKRVVNKKVFGKETPFDDKEMALQHLDYIKEALSKGQQVPDKALSQHSMDDINQYKSIKKLVEAQKSPVIQEIAKKKAKARKPSNQPVTLLSAIKAVGGLKLTEKQDITGEVKKFAPGGYNQLFRNDGTKSLKGVIESGALDDYLPPAMRLSANGANDDAYDSTEAYDYLVERIRNGERVLPYDVVQELEQKRFEQNTTDAVIELIADEFSEDDINAELQAAGYDEREAISLAQELDTGSEESGVTGSQGNQESTQGSAANDAPSKPQSQERGREQVTAIVLRRKVANELGKKKQFDQYLAAAKRFMAGENVSSTEFKMAAALFKADKQLNEAYTQLEALAKAPAKEARKEKASAVETYKQIIADAKSVPELQSIARDIQEETALNDATMQMLDDMVMDRIDALNNNESESNDAQSDEQFDEEDESPTDVVNIDTRDTASVGREAKARVSAERVKEIIAQFPSVDDIQPMDISKVVRKNIFVSGVPLAENVSSKALDKYIEEAKTKLNKAIANYTDLTENGLDAISDGAIRSAFGENAETALNESLKDAKNIVTSAKTQLAYLENEKANPTPPKSGTDLLGEDTRAKQAIADAQREKDAKRNSGVSDTEGFTLTGSNSEADKAIAMGAQDLFAQPVKPTAAPVDNNNDLEKLEKQLEKEIAKREAMQAKHMQKYRDGSATRAQTTTHNANVSWLNESIADLKKQIKQLKSENTLATEPPVDANVKKAQDDLNSALGDLGDIFGKNFRDNITPEQEQKLIPVLTRVFDAAFRLGYYEFKAAAKFVLDTIRSKISPDVADLITLDQLQGAYISMAGKYGDQATKKRDVVNVESIQEIQESNNVNDERSGTDLERNSQDTNAANSVGETNVQAGRNGNSGTGKPRVSRAQENSATTGSLSLFDSETVVTGERGNIELYTGASPTQGSLARDSDNRGSGDSSLRGTPIEPPATDRINEVAKSGLFTLNAQAEQKAADVIPQALSLENIRASLPLLKAGQQEDVFKAETKFAEPEGYGMLFTNGTGTGKTFTGMGVVKRFANSGKNNIIIIAPNDKIIEDWQNTGKMFNLKLNRLDNTSDAGQGIVITTYANFGANESLADRDWDLVVTDEAHYLAMDKDGTNTNALKTLRAITNNPQGAYTRYQMQNREMIAEAKRLSEAIDSNNKTMENDDTMDTVIAQLLKSNERMNKELSDIQNILQQNQKTVREQVQEAQGINRTRALFLSATPFAYEKTIDWANGYLFDYDEGKTQDGPSGTGGRGYNQGSNRDQFFIEKFGYRMRYNKLTEPDAKVNRGLMQRQFNTWLKKRGTLSGRMLDVEADYDRKFVLVDSAIGRRIDEALGWFEERRSAIKQEGGVRNLKANAYYDVNKIISDQFDYLSRRYLLEAIKAKEVIVHVKEHMALGRKVVVFHDYKKGGGFNPFNVQPGMMPNNPSTDQGSIDSVIEEFREEFADLIASPEFAASSPIIAFQKAFPNVLLFNGDVPTKVRRANVAKFQDDASGPQVILVQSAAGKEGISLHDTTGKHQRVLFNLGQPTQPTTSIQQEGRIYRTGQVTDAIFRYLNTGTNWERWAFATTIAQRASAAENLALGEQARALKDAFISSFEESDNYRAGMEGEGKGGKERDRAANEALTEYDRAKAFYYGTQKKSSKTKAQEGTDYFATPEPVGLKMVELADIRPGERVLEPSAGHGAIARWFPETSEKTAIEPSGNLRPRLAMVFDGAINGGTFEDLNVVNKYDAIIMNPPFGSAGKTAVDHVAKAATHLKDGGRIVALIPVGSTNEKFDKWFYGKAERKLNPVLTIPPKTIRGFDYPERTVYKGDTIETNLSWLPIVKVVSGNRLDDGLVVKVDGKSDTYSIDIDNIKKINRTGPRTEEYSPAEGLSLVADIKLPSVTFERAGTAVNTRIVVIEKSDNAPQQTNRDYTQITDINDLFDRMETLEIAERAKPKEQDSFDDKPAQVTAKELTKQNDQLAREREENAKASGAIAQDGQRATFMISGDKLYTNAPMEQVTTNSGKTLEGVFITDPTITLAKAKEVDRFAYYPKGKSAGIFVRLRHVERPSGDASFSNAAPIFYSALKGAIDAVKVNKADRLGWKGMIKNLTQKGIKQDEIEWSGINDWLDLQTGSITKGQVLDYLDANGVQVSETMMGGSVEDLPIEYDDLPDSLKAIIDQVDNEEIDAYSAVPLFREQGYELDMDLGGEINSVTRIGSGAIATKFERYTVPGGKNYRELLLTLPIAESPKTLPEGFTLDKGVFIRGNQVWEVNGPGLGRYASGISPEESIANFYKMHGDKKPYKSKHWDEANILAHVRFDERTDADGNKVLFINEIQSDWGQEGKKEGFKTGTVRKIDGHKWSKSEQETLGIAENHPAFESVDGNGVSKGIYLSERSAKLAFTGLPTAPFVTKTDAWVSLAIKRMMRYAVDNGFDKVAFINGQQAADLYKLSTQVDSIEWANHVSTGDAIVTLNPIGREYIKFQVDRKTGEVTQNLNNADSFVYKKLDDVVGKPMAEKILAEKFGTLKGEGLNIGGEGMRTFYDQIVPKVANDVLKKVGGGKVNDFNLVDNAKSAYIKLLKQDGFTDSEANNTANRKSPSEIIEILRVNEIEYITENTKQKALTITPAMRETVAGGLPLFRTGGTGSGLLVDDIKKAIANTTFGQEVDIYPTMMDAPVYVQYQAMSEGAFGVEGFFDKRTNRVAIVAENIKTLDRVTEVVRHELIGHYGMENMLGKELMGKLINRVLYSEKSGNATIKEIAKYVDKSQPGLSDKRRAKEIIAVMAERNLQNSIVKRVLDAIRLFLRKLGLLKEDVTDAKIAGLLREAQNYLKAKGQSYIEPQMQASYSVSADTLAAYEKRIDDLFNGGKANREGVKVLDNSDVLDMLGYGDLPVILAEGKVIAGQSNHHLTAKHWKKIPEWLENPAAVFNSETVPGSLVFIAPELLNGAPIVITIVPNEKQGKLDVHIVSNAYDKDSGKVPVARWVRDGYLRYIDKAKSRDFLTTSKLQLSRVLQEARGKGRKILVDTDLVKYRDGQSSFSNATKTGTEAFKRWFGDSKVVDENGKPLVVYHGTNKDFGEFDKSFDKLNRGFWFSTSNVASKFAMSDDRKTNGGNVMPAYLSIKKPYLYDANALNKRKNLTEIFNEAKSGGYDGVYLKSLSGKADTYVAFEPNQIKSAIGNNGNFDPNDDRISFSNNPQSRLTPQWETLEESKMDTAIRMLQDKHIDLKRVTQSIKQAGIEITDKWNAYLQEELFHGRTAKRVEDFLKNDLEPLIEDMRARDVTMADFEEYLWMRHAEERNIQIAKVNPDMPDGGAGVSTEEAQAYLAGLSTENKANFEALASRIDAITAKSRQVLIDYGLESAGTILKWQGAYKNYVPLMREDMELGFGNGTGSGFKVKGNASKRATGSNRAVVDIIANIAQQYERNVIRGEKNRVSTALIGLATLNPNEEFWQVDKPPTVTDINKATGLVETRTDPNYKNRPNVVVARVLNKRGEVVERSVIFNQSNERAMSMAKAINNVDQDQLLYGLGAISKVTRYFASINTQYNPIFGVVNITRDVQGSLLNLETTAIRGKQKQVMRNVLPALLGIYRDVRNQRKGNGPNATPWAQLFEDFQREGGQTGYRNMFSSAQERSEAMRKALDPTWWQNSKIGKVISAGGKFANAEQWMLDKAVKPIFDWLSDYNLALENAVRLSVYKVALDTGLTKQQAASVGKNISVNFNRKGQAATNIGALYAFFNASVQGSARIGETLTKRDDKGRIKLSGLGIKIVTGGLLLGGMQALALALAGYDEDEPPDFVRDRNLVIPLDMFGVDNKYVSIPMPLGYNAIPAIGRITTEWALSGFKNTPQRIVHMLDMMLDVTNPIGNAGLSAQTITPTFADPIVALSENKDFTGRDIAVKDFNSLNPTPGHSRARDTATAFSKATSYAINKLTGGTEFTPGAISPTPDQIDYLIGQVSGGVGREYQKIEQTFGSLTSGESLPPYKMPLVGRFYGDADSQGSQGNKFYSNLREINKHEAEIKGRRETGQDVSEYVKDNPTAILYKQANMFESTVKKMRKRKEALLKNNADKAQIAEVETLITNTMQRFNTLVESRQAADEPI